VRTTHTLVALSVGEKGAMPLNPLQLTGREAVPSLDLSGRKLGPGSAAVVAAGLSVNGVLTDLDLGSNNICSEGATALADALKVNVALTILDLSPLEAPFRAALRGGRVGIGDEGAAAIAESLKTNAVLKRLDLYDNHIGPEGGVAIGKALAVNEKLTFLNLSENKIGHKSSKVIKAQKRNESLDVYLEHPFMVASRLGARSVAPISIVLFLGTFPERLPCRRERGPPRQPRPRLCLGGAGETQVARRRALLRKVHRREARFGAGS